MLFKRKFCGRIVTGLSGVRVYALAYPRCSLKTARINASHLRPNPHIQEEVVRLRAQAHAIAGPVVLALIEKLRWLARVVRVNLALLNPKIDGDLLVSLHVHEGRKIPRMRKIRISDKIGRPGGVSVPAQLVRALPPHSKTPAVDAFHPFPVRHLVPISGELTFPRGAEDRRNPWRFRIAVAIALGVYVMTS
jgi:hypothetical protein